MSLTIVPSVERASPLQRISLQTRALLVDAYREVNSKKLFWISIILSTLVVAGVGCFGINERGVTILTWEIKGVWNTNLIPRDEFYKYAFTVLAIPFWLGLFAMILALVSTCSMFPDLLVGGSIDMYLARPISRLRLFLTKYCVGLMFCALQVGAFCLASFLVIGIRGGGWEFGIFLAIPLVTLFFSYLFCICVLIGIVTRSTLAALIITLLFWAFVFAMNSTDGLMTLAKSAAQERVDMQQTLVDFNKGVIEKNNQLPPEQRSDVSQFAFQMENQKKDLIPLQEDLADISWWHRLVVLLKAPLPKTQETVSLMSRWLVDPSPFMEAEQQQQQRRDEWRNQRGRNASARGPESVDMGDAEVQRRAGEEYEARSAASLIGSSLLFECAILALASWIFCRRDF